MLMATSSLGTLTFKAPQALQGLGLTVQQTYALARAAGFDEAHAKQMVAIAQRESGLNPNVTAMTGRESSYGLWQINAKDPNVWARVRAATGITSPEQLKDPQINAQAAYALWNGNDANLDIAWYINRNTPSIPYADRYNAFYNSLPSVDALESSYSGGAANGSDIGTDTGGFDISDYFGSSAAPNEESQGTNPWLIASLAVGVFALVSLASD